MVIKAISESAKTHNPIKLYAVNKAVDFVPYVSTALNLAETSVTEQHWCRSARREPPDRSRPWQLSIYSVIKFFVLAGLPR